MKKSGVVFEMNSQIRTWTRCHESRISVRTVPKKVVYAIIILDRDRNGFVAIAFEPIADLAFLLSVVVHGRIALLLKLE